jgi:hypothetical protein
MRRFIFCVLILALSSPAWSQTQTDSTKTKSKTTHQQPKTPKPLPKPRPPRPARAKKNGKKEPQDPAIVTEMGELPLEFLPTIKEYLDKKNKENPRAKTKDDPFFRRTLIHHLDADNNYLELEPLGQSN